MLKKITVWFQDTKKPKALDYAILFFIFILFYFTYLYTDVSITTRFGINFWDFLFQGKLLQFYELNANTIFYNYLHCDALYDFLMYLIFAVWDFPLWIAEHALGIDALNSTLCMLWAKGIMLPFFYGSIKVMKKICGELNFLEGHTKWCIFLYMSSAFVLSSMFMLCQYDIIGIFFFMIGIYYYMKGDMKKFTLWIAVSIAIKTFALFFFIPLVLLKEKKVLKVAGYTLCSMSISLIFQILFTLLGTTPTGSFLFSMANKLMIGTIPAGLGNASLFVGFYLLLCIFCYLKKTDSKEEHNRFAVYLPFAVWAFFLMFAEVNPYWAILITPFFPLVIFQNKERFKVSLLIETAATTALILAQNFFFPWVFSYKWIMGLMPFAKLIHPIPRMVQENNLAVLGAADLDTSIRVFGMPLALGIFLFSMAALLVLNFPTKRSIEADKGCNLVIERSVLWCRLACGAGICMLPMAFYFLDLFLAS